MSEAFHTSLHTAMKARAAEILPDIQNENPAAKFLRSGINLYAKTAKSLISNSFQAQKKPTIILSKLRWTYGPSDRVRTCGLMVPNHPRYQLRYTRI